MLRPSKAELDSIEAMLVAGAETPRALAEAVIKEVELQRQSRVQWVSVLELTPGVYQGYGMWATRLMAEKQLPKIPQAQSSRRGAFVPVLGMAAVDAALAKADEPPAERGDFRIAREDARAFRAGWKGNMRDRDRYLQPST